MPHEFPARIACHSKLHLWGTRDEAARCCNGWTRLYAPWFYGSEFVDRSQWYQPGSPAMFSIVLVPSVELDEIARLRSIVPLDLQARLCREGIHLH